MTRNVDQEADTLATVVARMARIGSCWSPSFSPDGTRIAFISDLNGVPQVWIVPTEGGWPELVTALDDQILGVTWSPTGEWLSFNLAPGGGMNAQIYRVRPDGSDLRRLTDGGKENNLRGAWTHDGKHILMASNRRGAIGLDAYLLDPETGTMQLVAELGGIGGINDISRDGRYTALYRVVQRGDSNLYLRELATGEEHLLTPHEGPGHFAAAQFSPDGRTLYLLSDDARERIAFARILLDADHRPGRIELLAGRDAAECESFALTEDGSTAALMWNVAGRSELVFMDLATGEVTTGPALPAEMAGSLTFSQDGRMLAMVCNGSVAPQDIWVLDRTTGR
ncbi:MAG TPA: hypothetical protein VKU00_33075, partial [Chthonomonadaceae bacterium]|nr:hypothetical protein [Chthonomonadaceae bacterium]